MFLTIVLVAAMNASGQISSPTQINQRDGVNLEKLSKSALDGLSEDEKTRRWAEHERVGRDLAEVFGFKFGDPLADYGFALAAEQQDDPSYPIYDLASPAFGFVQFRPHLMFGRLCGVLLIRPVPPCEDEEQRQAAFVAADYEVCTNLASAVGVLTNDLTIATNGVPHVWRISLERWRHAQVLRVGDGELVAKLVRAAKAEKEAKELERIRHLMQHDEPSAALKAEAKEEKAE